MCAVCLKELQKAYDFRLKCQSTQSYLLKMKRAKHKIMAIKANPEVIKIKCPVAEAEFMIIENDNNEVVTEAKDEPELEQPMENELSFKEKINLDDYAKEMLEINIIKDETSTAVPIQMVETNDYAQCEEINKSGNEDAEDDDIFVVNTINVRRLKEDSGRPSHNARSNCKRFICDQCGNHFSSRQHFTVHLRRHTGDKKYECE